MQNAEYFESFWKFFRSTYSSKYPELERTLLNCLTGIVEAEYSSDYECSDYYVYLGVDLRRVKLTKDSDTGDSRLTALIPKNINEISCDFLVFLSKNFISHMELVKNHRSRDPLQVRYEIIPEREMKEILEKIDTCLVGRPKVTTLHFCWPK